MSKLRMIIVGIDGENCVINVDFNQNIVLVFSDDYSILEQIKFRAHERMVDNYGWLDICDLLYCCGVESNSFIESKYFKDYGWGIDDIYEWKIDYKPTKDSKRKCVASFRNFRVAWPLRKGVEI